MQQMDRLHPLIDKKCASLRRSFFFIQIDSSHFFVAITNYIANVYKISKKIQLHFPEAWLLHFLDKMATANKIEEQTFLSFACDHLLVEMVSTEKFTLMCRLHTPVYLFENPYQNSFIKWHFMVSNTPPIFLKKIFCI